MGSLRAQRKGRAGWKPALQGVCQGVCLAAGCVGQAGDLRPIYYNMKRANYFARSFAGILENSTNADAQYRNFATGVRVLFSNMPAKLRAK